MLKFWGLSRSSRKMACTTAKVSILAQPGPSEALPLILSSDALTEGIIVISLSP